MILTTSRLTLRPFTEADAFMTYKYSQEPSRALGIPSEVYADEAEALGVLQYLIGQYDGYTLPYVLAIDAREAGYIGHVGVSEIAAGVEIGYAICEAAQGRGYATEAVHAFTPWVMEKMGFTTIYGMVRRANDASKRVLEKAGYAFIKEDREGEYAPGGEYDVYRLTL